MSRGDFPALLGAAGFTRGDPAFDEVVAFVAMVHSRSSVGMNGAVNPDDVRQARRCVEAAVAGDDWRAIAGLPARRAGTARPDPVT